MDIKQARSFAEELGVLKFFPAQMGAVAKVAEMIADLCVNEFQAKILVKEMVERFDEWPGPATMCAVHAERFGGKKAVETEWQHEWKTERACVQCSDLGFFMNRFRMYQRCDCEAGPIYGTDELLADYNKRLTPRGFVRATEVKTRVQ